MHSAHSHARSSEETERHSIKVYLLTSHTMPKFIMMHSSFCVRVGGTFLLAFNERNRLALNTTGQSPLSTEMAYKTANNQLTSKYPTCDSP